MKNKKRIQGSVLIEAIVAVVIMATCLTMIMQSFAGQYRATVLHQDYVKGLVLLENRLSELMSQGIGRDFIKNDEPCPEPFGRYHYLLKSQEFILKGEKGLRQIDLSVAWASGKKERSIDVSTYILSDVNQTTQTTF